MKNLLIFILKPFAITFLILTLIVPSLSSREKNLDSLRQLMISSSNVGMYSDALDFCNQIAILAIEIGDDDFYMESQIDKIEILRAMGDLKLGLEIVEEAKKYQQKQNFYDFDPILLNREAAVHFEMGNIDKSIACTKKSIAGRQNPTFRQLELSNLILLSANFREQNKLDSSNYFIQMAIEKAILKKDTSNLILAFYNAGNNKKTAQDYDSAIYYANQAYDLARRINSRIYLREIYGLLSFIELELENFEKAVHLRDSFFNISNEILKNSSRQRVDFFLAKFELDKADLEYELVKSEASFRKLQLLFVLGFTLLMIVALVLIVLQNRKLKLQSDKIDEQNKLLSKSLELKNMMFSVVAHDLRSPINTLDFLATEISNTYEIPEAAENFTIFKNQINQVTFLVDNLLKWAMTSLDRLELNKVQFNLSDSLLESLDFFTSSLRMKNIVLKKDFPPNPVFIFADKEIISTIFRNLVSNAIKFTPEGGEITVAIKLNDNGIKITVKDTGVGLDIEQLRDIEKSLGSHTYGTNNEPGSGLGLYLCNTFAAMHSGKITFESQKNKGTTVTVKFDKKILV